MKKITDAKVIENMKRYINQYEWDYNLGYNPTDEGLNRIMETFKTNKANLIKLFEKSPYYNGRYQIVLKDETYSRKIDVDEIFKFTHFLGCSIPVKTITVDLKSANIFVTQIKTDQNYYGITDQDSLLKVLNIDGDDLHVLVVGHKRARHINHDFWVKTEHFKSISPKEMAEIKDSMYFLNNSENTNEGISHDCSYLQNLHEKETYSFEDFLEECNFDLVRRIRETIELIKRITTQYLDANNAIDFNTYFPELRAREGQKTTRVVDKFCTKIMGLKKERGSVFASRFSAYCDAMNPLTTPRWTIISINPVDFLAMSNGYDWASCHTLNKLRSDGNYYNGCYSSGTLSYLLDGTSMVFYTVQRSYEGNEFEFEPKMVRCMFHYGEDKLIQGRVYPQDNDGVNAIYKEIRPIIQRVFSEILDVPNLWRNTKGTSICGKVSIHEGTHFRDILEFDNCNVSFYGATDSEIEKNMTKIAIGHNPICPRCGHIHSTENNILCGNCRHELLMRN